MINKLKVYHYNLKSNTFRKEYINDVKYDCSIEWEDRPCSLQYNAEKAESRYSIIVNRKKDKEQNIYCKF